MFDKANDAGPDEGITNDKDEGINEEHFTVVLGIDDDEVTVDDHDQVATRLTSNLGDKIASTASAARAAGGAAKDEVEQA